MFEYDGTLFKSACNKTLEALLSLEGLKTTIIELQSFSENYEGKEIVNDVTNNLLKITNQISILFDEMKNTLCLILGNDIMNQKLVLEDSDGILNFLDGTIEGEYGTNQSGAYLLFKKYLENPNSLSDIEKKKVELIYNLFKDYNYVSPNNNIMYFVLNAFSNGGCGIASISNVIIDKYSKLKNGEKLFEEKYGFPLYYVDEYGNKRYNYEALHTKINLNYTSKELNYDIWDVLGVAGANEDRDYIKYIDEFNTFVSVYTRNSGIVNPLFVKILNDELSNDFPISTKVKKYGNIITTIGIGNNEFDELVSDYNTENLNHDYCVISAHSFTLKPYGESTIKEYGNKSMSYNAGHYMTITGISENANPIVSSWGYKFELLSSNKSELIYIDVGDKNE